MEFEVAKGMVMAVALFWVWHLFSWLCERGRWLKAQRRGRRPRFLGTLPDGIAGVLLNIPKVIGALLPLILGIAGAHCTLAFIIGPLIPEWGPLTAWLAGLMVYGSAMALGIVGLNRVVVVGRDRFRREMWEHLRNSPADLADIQKWAAPVERAER